MPRGVLFIGGRGPGPQFISRHIDPADVICAADSGLDAALAAGFRPDGIVGDFDSISDTALLDSFPPSAVHRYPVDKDDTDTEIGLSWLRERNCSPLVLIGGGEGRLDHTVAILNLFAREGHPAAWYTAVEEIRALQGSVSLPGVSGNSISLVPVGGGPWTVASRGLDWPLDEVDWSAGNISLSNRFSGNGIELDVSSGVLLSMRPLEDV